MLRDLRRVFGTERYDNLPYDGRVLLKRDVSGIMDEENCTTLEASMLLCQRIGGPDVLKSYVDSLMAGARVRGEI